MVQHSSLCWQRDQLTRPCSAPAVSSFSPSPKAGWEPWAGAVLCCSELCLSPVLILFLLSSLGSGRVGSFLPLTFAHSGLSCPALALCLSTWARGEKVGAWRTWPGSGQPAEEGQSCGSSSESLPAEREPRRSMTQSWVYTGTTRCACSRAGLCSSAQLCSLLCQATASPGFNWALWDM